MGFNSGFKGLILGSDRGVFHTHTSRRLQYESGDFYSTCNML